MKYFVLYSDYEYDYSFNLYETEKELLKELPEYKRNYKNVIVIKGKQLEIKTNYSLEE